MRTGCASKSALEDCARHLDEYEGLPPVHSCMVGRGAWYDPWKVLATADVWLGGEENPAVSRRSVLDSYLAYADEQSPLLDVAEDALYRGKRCSIQEIALCPMPADRGCHWQGPQRHT